MHDPALWRAEFGDFIVEGSFQMQAAVFPRTTDLSSTSARRSETCTHTALLYWGISFHWLVHIKVTGRFCHFSQVAHHGYVSATFASPKPSTVNMADFGLVATNKASTDTSLQTCTSSNCRRSQTDKDCGKITALISVWKHL